MHVSIQLPLTQKTDKRMVQGESADRLSLDYWFTSCVPLDDACAPGYGGHLPGGHCLAVGGAHGRPASTRGGSETGRCHQHTGSSGRTHVRVEGGGGREVEGERWRERGGGR